MRRTGVLAEAEVAFATLREALTQSPRGASCHVFLGARAGKTKEERWRRLRFGRAAASSFRASLMEQLAEQVSGEAELVQFVEDLAGGRIGVARIGEPKELGDWIADLPAPDWPHTLAPDDAFLQKVALQAARLAMTDDAKPLLVFRTRTRTALLRSGGFLTSFSSSRNEFVPVEGDVLDLALDADFLAWQDLVFILRQRPFETITNLRNATLAKAHKGAEGLAAVEGLRIEGLPEVMQAVATRPQLARKLAAAQTVGAISQLQPQAMAELVERRGLSVDVRQQDGVVHVSVDATKADQVKDFVELISDDYVRGILTSKEYRTFSKEAL